MHVGEPAEFHNNIREAREYYQGTAERYRKAQQSDNERDTYDRNHQGKWSRGRFLPEMVGAAGICQ